MIENKKTHDFFYEVLSKLQHERILRDFVLVGSWCLFFYKDLFKDHSFSILRTRDVDFLISTPPTFKIDIDVPKLLKDMGFLIDLHKDGFMKFGHPQLGIDFLVAQKGGYTDRPYKIQKLKIAAQPLPFLQLLLVDTISLEKDGLSLTLPHPIRFAFHKLLISPRRKDKTKQLRDCLQANEVLECCLSHYDISVFQHIWISFRPKWQKAILGSIRNENLVKLLS